MSKRQNDRIWRAFGVRSVTDPDRRGSSDAHGNQRQSEIRVMASFFEWDAKYDLGVAAMDAEHVQIVGCMNRLHELHEKKSDRASLTSALADLLKVTRKHFADEEAYMEKMNYPDLRKHKHMHVHLLDRLGTFESEFRTTGNAPAELFPFLKMWLKAHICGIDTKYANYGKVA
jgi:hemerythrin